MNNNSIPGWDFERDTFVTNEKKPIRQDQEFVELLWQNGQVVMQSQSHKNLRQVQKTDRSTTLRTSGPPYGNTSNLTQEDEKATWIQNHQYPFEELLEQEFYSNLLSELAPHHATLSSQELPNMKPSCVEEFQGNHPIPAPPRFNEINHSSKKSNDFCGSQKVQNFPHFSAPQFGEKVISNVSQSEVRECSVMTVGSSHCGSNQILNKDCVQRTIPLSDKKGKSEMVEPSVTSSSGGSGSSIGRTCSLISTRNQGQKRKGIDAEASEELSEFTEQKSGDGNKASKRTGSSRRNRVAEVHNLSERRRRDRINEKMRALQQLIPNSNKTDKASMLEEAIEYLKSLQLQLQVMWMGAGMTPMMFPGIQQFMSQMSMGVASPSLSSIKNPMQLPTVSPDQSTQVPQMPNQTMMCQNPVLSAFNNYQNQMQNPCFPEQFARYMGYHLMQSASQPMNVFRYGPQPHAMQHSQTMNVAPINSSGPITQAANIDHSSSGKSGSSIFN